MSENFTHEMGAALAHYLADPTRNKVAAYRATHDCAGMTAYSVNARAKRLFNHEIVQESVKHLNAVCLHKAEVNAQWIMDRLQRIADFNIDKFMVVGPDGLARYDFSEATEDDWYCIDEYSVDTVAKPGKGDEPVIVEKVKIKTASRMNALKLLGELASVAAFKDNLHVTGEVVVRNFNDFYGECEAIEDGEAKPGA